MVGGHTVLVSKQRYANTVGTFKRKMPLMLMLILDTTMLMM